MQGISSPPYQLGSYIPISLPAINKQSNFCGIINTTNVECKCDNNHLIMLGDSIDLLQRIRTNTIDLIFADPPYNIGKVFGNNKDKWETTNDYITWCKKWIDECFRVLKDNGTFYFMTATQYMPYLDTYVQEKYNVVNRIVWTYDSSGVQSKNSFGSLYEPIIMATKYKNSDYVFNNSEILVEAKTGAKRGLIDYRRTPPQLYSTKKVPGNVWNFNRVRFLMDEYEDHPTQKPEVLLERIVLASSNPNGIVLDPFCGTFTTSAVAAKYGRKSIGIELNENFFKIGIRRLKLDTHYNGEKLEKNKSKKTKNKSKKDHLEVNQ